MSQAETKVGRKEEAQRRKRMHNIVAAFQQYVSSYHTQYEYESYSDKTFINDMLYGIGIAIDAHAHQFSNGYDVWKSQLREHLRDDSDSREKS